MRLIAYLNPSEDAAAMRQHLLAQPGVGAVACRSGRHWTSTSRAEAGFAACYAPDYPGIRAAYAAAGVPEFNAPGPAAPWDPREVATLEPAEVITILCHGKHAKRELVAAPPIGLLIAVNHSAQLLPGVVPDILVANDGFIGPIARCPCKMAAVRGGQRATLPNVPYFDLARLGVDSGIVSVLCAVLLAEHMGVRRLRLIGHDCLPGIGAVKGDSWGTGHIKACERDTAVHLRRLAAAGVAVEHVRSDGSQEWIETYQQESKR
jgi:hypothetical protein